MRPLTPLETALVIAIGGSVLAATVPTFVANLHASRLTEPLDGLESIAARATLLAAQRDAEHAYPDSVGLTPAQVPRGELVVDPPGTWDHPTWRQLAFRWDVAHAYSFSFESERKAGEARFRAVAKGDLDGDGILSTFAIAGITRDGAEPIVSTLSIHREVE